MRVVCVLILQKAEMERLAEIFFRFTPQVSVGESSVFLEISGCQKLYSEASLKARVQVLLKRFGLSYRLAVAGDIPTALALASFQKGHRDLLPIEALQIFASPFRTSQSMLKVIGIFKRLGIQTLQQLRRVPRDKLTSRFGKEAVLAIHHVETAAQTPWRRFVPPERVVEFCDIDESYLVRELEPILFLLRGMLDRALLRLRGRGELASVVELRLEQERYSTVQKPVRTLRVELAFPQGASFGLFPLLRERLTSHIERTPLEAALRRVEFEIIKTIPSGSRQTDFFSKKEEELESLRSILARLTDQLGSERVFFASPVETYVPEKSWTKTLDPVTSLQVPLASRPLRILKVPQKIQRLGENFIFRSKRWRILEMEGPERLSGEWWWHEPERDYYRVRLESGEEFWIFQSEAKDYFLHGVFD